MTGDPESHYANCFQVSHSPYEVVIDFGEYRQGDPAHVWHCRVVTIPAFAQDLVLLLSRAIHELRRAGQIPEAAGEPADSRETEPHSYD